MHRVYIGGLLHFLSLLLVHRLHIRVPTAARFPVSADRSDTSANIARARLPVPAACRPERSVRPERRMFCALPRFLSITKSQSVNHVDPGFDTPRGAPERWPAVRGDTGPHTPRALRHSRVSRARQCSAPQQQPAQCAACQASPQRSSASRKSALGSSS